MGVFGMASAWEAALDEFIFEEEDASNRSHLVETKIEHTKEEKVVTKNNRKEKTLAEFMFEDEHVSKITKFVKTETKKENTKEEKNVKDEKLKEKCPQENTKYVEGEKHQMFVMNVVLWP